MIGDLVLFGLQSFLIILAMIAIVVVVGLVLSFGTRDDK